MRLIHSVLTLTTFFTLWLMCPGRLPAQSPPAGVKSTDKVAIVYLYPSDAEPSEIFTLDSITNHFQGTLVNFWREMSHGAYSPQITIFYKQIPLTKEFLRRSGHEHYVIDELNKSLPDNGDLAVPGYVPSDYGVTQILLGGNITGYGGGNAQEDIRVNGVLYPSQNLGSFTYGSQGSFLRFGYYNPDTPFRGRANSEVMRYPELGLLDADGTLLHEWGHALGLSTHANFWRSEKEPFYGEIYYNNSRSFWNQGYDYGNAFDLMGGNIKYSLHFNAFYQDLLGWMQPQEKVMLTSSQADVEIMPLEGNHGGKRCAILAIDPGKLVRPDPFDPALNYSFYIEYRQPIGADKHLGHPYLQSNTEGLMINLARRKGNEFIQGALLDMSPDTIVHDKSPTLVVPNTIYNEDDHHECTLNKGRTFYDEQTEWTIRNVRANGLSGVRFNVEKGKKDGAKSGVYAVRMFDGDMLTNDTNIPFASEDLTLLFYIQSDGNLVSRKASDNSFVAGSAQLGIVIPGQPDRLELQGGNLVAYSNGERVWHSNTGENPGAYAKLDNDGIFRVYSSSGEILFPVAVSGIEMVGSGKIQVSPNPVRSQLHISAPEGALGTAYMVHNSMGVVKLSGKIRNEQMILDVQSFEPGVYFVRFGNGMPPVKVVKQ